MAPRLAALALGLLLAAALPARAAVNGSAHDLVSQGYDVKKEGGSEETCKPCHLRVNTPKDDFLARVPPSLAAYDRADLLCFSCHDGVTIASEFADASATAFHPGSHGFEAAALPAALPAGDLELPLNAGGGRLGCVTCHDAHDNTVRPFLRRPLEEICDLCHGALAVSVRGKENLAGSHPVEIPEEEMMRFPQPAPILVSPPLSIPFPLPYPTRGGKASVGTHWDLGGHLTGGDSGSVTCQTCHAVHGDEADPPGGALLSVDPVGVKANRLCEGCHRGFRADGGKAPPWPNPGGTATARTYHPVDDDTGNGGGRIVKTREPPAWPLGSDASRPLLCTTCHRAHGAWPATPLLRRPTVALTFCEECHDEMPLEYHHPLEGTPGEGCASKLPPPLWGEEERTGLLCEDCHRAHNAGLGAVLEEEYVPLLRERLGSTEACEECHDDDDPTCAAIPGGEASHFVGDPTLPETFADGEPPLREEPWPETGLVGFYDGETNREVTCLSCHTFKKEGILLEGGGGHLLARAGNDVEWEEGGEDAYLCTGCHSAAPGTKGGGRSHPLMDADAVSLGREIEPPVTTTPSGRINCDSCHRSHGAVSAGGYYILEIIGGANTDPKAVHPRIDFTGICHRCHGEEEY